MSVRKENPCFARGTDLSEEIFRSTFDNKSCYLEYVFTCFLVLSTSLSSAVRGDQLALMKSQYEILRTRKCAYRHSILNQAIRYIP